MPDIRIYISTHKECWLPERDFLFPIQVGAACAERHFPGMLHDDEGDNISHKNPCYCELTAQYWAWKNTDADYYGFFHYRRYMSFAAERFPVTPFQDVMMERADERALQKLCLDRKTVQEYVEKYDAIATTEVNLDDLSRQIRTNYRQYDMMDYQYKEDLDALLEILKEKYPAYYDDARAYLESSKGYYCNMFLMRAELFRQYCAWLFDILAEHEKRRDYSNYSKMGYRVSGYLGERLFGIFFCHLKKEGRWRLAECQRTLFRRTDVPKPVRPFGGKEQVAAALAANDYFIPYTAVTIASLLSHADPGRKYDILLLSDDISDANRKRLQALFRDYPNARLSILDPSELLEDYSFYVKDHFSKETYYRLVLPELLPDYDRILYLDSDMVICRDIAELYDTELGDALLGACRDPDSAGLYNGYIPGKKDYVDRILKLKNPYDYFQAGTILMNLAAFRAGFRTEEILQFAVRRNWQLLDQDILNVLCEGRVQFLDLRWNVMTDMQGIRIREIIGRAPHWLYDAYMEARKQPFIIHYAGPEKPWKNPEMDMADVFWQYARRGPWYETILYRMSRDAADVLLHPVKERKPVREVLLPYGSRRREIAKEIYYKFVH